MLEWMFNTDGFMPRGGCHSWTADVLFLQVFANLLIAAAYFIIPGVLLYSLRRLTFPGWSKVAIVAAGLFIFSCGIGHIVKVLMIWHPMYRLEGYIDLITGIISVVVALKARGWLKRLQTEIVISAENSDLIEHVGDGCWSLDVRTGKDFISQRYYQTLGYTSGTEDPMVQHMSDWIDILHPDDRAKCTQAIEHTIATGEPYEVHARLRRADGTYAHRLDRGLAIKNDDGRVIRLVGVHTDITHTVEHQERLEAALADVDHFAMVTSHGLQEPLRGVANAVELMAHDYSNVIEAAHKEDPALMDPLLIGQNITGGVMRMARLLTDLLAFYNASNMKHSGLIDLHTVIDRAFDQCSAYTHDTTITHDFDEDVVAVVGNEGLLVQALSQVIENTVRYGIPPTKIHCSVVQRESFCHIAISDNGIGVEPKNIDKVFDVMFRYPRNDDSGTGMGLAIVKKVVFTHKGKCWMESEGLGRGATVHIQLPSRRETQV